MLEEVGAWSAILCGLREEKDGRLWLAILLYEYGGELHNLGW